MDRSGEMRLVLAAGREGERSSTAQHSTQEEEGPRRAVGVRCGAGDRAAGRAAAAAAALELRALGVDWVCGRSA